jgi:DNA repair protein SbcD/Mre11
MRPLRIAHVSDTHLGYRALFRSDPETGRNQRSVDFERAYETVVDDILTRDVDLVIHAGDVFHHTRPTWSAIRAFVREARKLTDRDLPIIVIGGNHDTPRLRTSGSVFSVLELVLPGIRFVCGYEQETIDFPDLEIVVTAIPHGKLVDLLGPSAFPRDGTRNVLVTHGFVPGMQMGRRRHEPGEEDVADYLLAPEFDYIALGHYHVFQRVRHNAWYSGSTERNGWGDEDVTPGYALVEFDGVNSEPVVEHIPIDARPMKTLGALDGDGKSAQEMVDLTLARIDRDVPSNGMARIEFLNTPRPVRREAEAILRRESPEHVWSLQVYAPADVLSGFQQRAGEFVTADVATLFADFVAERKYVPEFETRFRERGMNALEEAARLLEHATAMEDQGS